VAVFALRPTWWEAVPSLVDPDLLPVLHRCAQRGCRSLTYTGRCPAHSTPEDAELRNALADAAAELVIARERVEEAVERLAVLEARAGIRRG
jgi:hypothetical protein